MLTAQTETVSKQLTVMTLQRRTAQRAGFVSSRSNFPHNEDKSGNQGRSSAWWRFHLLGAGADNVIRETGI